MNGKLLPGLLLSLCLALPATAAETMDNAQVVQMIELGLDDGTIEAKIEASPTRFDTSPTALAALKSAGVSPQVIKSMIRSGSSGSVYGSSNGTANGRDQHLALVGNDQSETALTAVRVISEVSHRKQWIPVVGSFMKPETFMTIVGQRADVRTGAQPSFITTIDPISIRLVHLDDNGEGGRYVVFSGATSDREIKIVGENLGGGQHKLTPETPLEAGQEYAFVVSPQLASGMGFWEWFATASGNAGKAYDFGVN